MSGRVGWSAGRDGRQGRAARTSRRRAGALGALIVVLAACGGTATPAPATRGPVATAASGGATATPAGASPGGSTAKASAPAPVGALRLKPGPDLCSILKSGDFTVAGVPGAGPVTKNAPDASSFSCVYAGASSGTGGIEFDIFIVDPPSPDDTVLGVNGFGAVDITAAVPGADKALFDADPVATIGVRSGNIVFDIGFPAGPTAQDAAVALAKLVLLRATALAGG